MHACVGETRENRRFERVTEPAHPPLACLVGENRFHRRRETGHERYALGARAPAPFLRPAGHERRELGSLPEKERPDALGRVHFVPRDRDAVGAERAHVDRYPPGCLRGVAVQVHAAAPADRRDLRDRLEHPRLVVRQHHGDDSGSRSHGALYRGGIDEPPLAAADDGHLAPFAAQRFGGREYRGMLDRADHDVATFTRSKRDASDSCVIRFRAAAR